MLTAAVVLGLVVAGSRTTGSPAPKDPCTLLTSAEVQTLAPGAKIGPGVSTKVGEMAVDCEWKWGAGNTAQSLQVDLGDNAKTWPGTSPSDLTLGLMLLTKTQGATAVAVPGVGDAAIFDSSGPNRAEATALVKGSNIHVALQGPDARTKKAQVISLLKAAIGRL